MASLLDEIEISQPVIQNPSQPSPHHVFNLSPIIPFYAEPSPPPGVLITPQHTHPAFSHLCLFAQAAPWASDAIPPLQST